METRIVEEIHARDVNAPVEKEDGRWLKGRYGSPTTGAHIHVRRLSRPMTILYTGWSKGDFGFLRFSRRAYHILSSLII